MFSVVAATLKEQGKDNIPYHPPPALFPYQIMILDLGLPVLNSHEGELEGNVTKQEIHNSAIQESDIITKIHKSTQICCPQHSK